MTLRLSEEIRKALSERVERGPLQLVDPVTNETYFLLSQDQFQSLQPAGELAAELAAWDRATDEATGNLWE